MIAINDYIDRSGCHGRSNYLLTNLGDLYFCNENEFKIIKYETDIKFNEIYSYKVYLILVTKEKIYYIRCNEILKETEYQDIYNFYAQKCGITFNTININENEWKNNF